MLENEKYSQSEMSDDMNEDKIYIELEFPDNLSNSRNNNDVDKEIVFKNYIPYDKNFRIETLTYFNTISEIEKNYEKKIRKKVKDFINLEKNPLNIIPKKNNIDLKKALTSKLEKLNRRTEIAILEIIKENIQREQNGDIGKNIMIATEIQKNLDEIKDDESDISSDYDKGLDEL